MEYAYDLALDILSDACARSGWLCRRDSPPVSASATQPRSFQSTVTAGEKDLHNTYAWWTLLSCISSFNISQWYTADHVMGWRLLDCNIVLVLTLYRIIPILRNLLFPVPVGEDAARLEALRKPVSIALWHPLEFRWTVPGTDYRDIRACRNTNFCSKYSQDDLD